MALRPLTRSAFAPHPFGTHSRTLTWLAIAAAVGGTGFLAAAPAAQAASAGHPVVVAARPAVPPGATRLDPVPSTQTITGAVALKPRDPAGLSKLAEAITTKGSSAYHHYLQPGVFARYFAPTPATISAVTSSLREAGLTVTKVASNGMLVDFHATARVAESAFGTTIANYRLAGGRIAYAPTTALTLPSTIAGAVQTVVGLSNVALPHPMLTGSDLMHGKKAALKVTKAGLARPAAAASTGEGPVPCKAALRFRNRNDELTADQIAHSYGMDGLFAAGDTGAGQTVDIFELEPFKPSDVQKFDTCYFGATRAAAMVADINVIPVDGGMQNGPGEGEAALDVEDVSALAPGAKINVYEAPSIPFGWLDEFNQMVSDDNSSVISASYGLCEQLMNTLPGILPAENVIFQQAAVQGQSVLASSGDSGADSCAPNGSPAPSPPFLSTLDPSMQPYVLSVGGTSIVAPTEPPQERVWNDGAGDGGAGGGLSSVWTEPAWQSESTVPGMNNPQVLAAAKDQAALLGDSGDFCADDVSTCREGPDVSALADEFNGTEIIYDGSVIGIGGTSSSTPFWAAILADINASTNCQTSGGVGFVSPELYSLASVPSEYAASFNDVKVGNNDQYGILSGLYPATKGFDMSSGLGTPRVTGPITSSGTYPPGLAYYLCAAAANTAPTVSGISPQAINSDGSGTFTITGSGFQDSGDSLVAGITIDSFEVPTADYTVDSATQITVHGLTNSELQGVGTTTNGDTTANVTVTLIGGATSRLTPASRLVVYTPDGSGNATPVLAGVGRVAGNEAGGYTVHLYGSGFANASSVTFGGVPGTDLSVRGDTQLTVTAPAYQPGSQNCLNGEDPTTDVCQTQVVVHTPTGHSTTDTSSILPETTGDFFNPAPGTEEYQAPTEFDYLPTPTLTGITIDTGLPLASELGGDPVTATGTGLGVLGLLWFDVGNPTKWLNEDFSYFEGDATSVDFTLPAEPGTANVLTKQITVQTEGSTNVTGNDGNLSTTAPSNAVSVDYAPTPVVRSISTGTSHRAGPVTGGTPLKVNGAGFNDPFDFAQFVDLGPFPVSLSTQYLISPNAAGTQIAMQTPASVPGVDGVEICGISGCSVPQSEADVFTFFPTGDPVVTGIQPEQGAQGSTVRITGYNLGFARQVYFGHTRARFFGNPPQILDSGDLYHVVVLVPKGKIGSTVPVRLATLESLVEHPKHPLTPATAAAQYTYTKASTKLELDLKPAQPKANQPEKITAILEIRRALLASNGTVTFFDNGAAFATKSVHEFGEATVTHRFTKGRHVLKVVYSGTSKLNGCHARKTLKVT